MSLFCFVIFVGSLLPTAVTHGDIRVVAADEHLTAFGYYVAVSVDSSVYNSLFAAGANGLDLGDRVSNLKKASATFEKMGEKIGSETVAENGDLIYVHNSAELIHLCGGEELALDRKSVV